MEHENLSTDDLSNTSKNNNHIQFNLLLNEDKKALISDKKIEEHKENNLNHDRNEFYVKSITERTKKQAFEEEIRLKKKKSISYENNENLLLHPVKCIGQQVNNYKQFNNMEEGEKLLIDGSKLIKEDELDKKLIEDAKKKKIAIKSNKVFQEKYDSKFEIYDSDKGKLIIKTKVLKSSKDPEGKLTKLNNSHLMRQHSEDKIKMYKNLNPTSLIDIDLKQFEWDNLKAYQVKEEKMKNKQVIDHTPKVNILD